MPLKTLLWPLLMLLFCASKLHSQNNQFNFNKFDVDNGLSHNQVYSIFRDSVGFMWFGTASGLNRYDGYSSKVFVNNPADSNSLEDNYVSEILALPDNKMWVGCKSGLAVYDPVTESFDRHYQRYLKGWGLPQSKILFSKKDRHGDFWFLFEKEGVFKYSVSTRQTSHFTTSDKLLASKNITHFSEDTDGNFWLIFSNGALVQVDFRRLHSMRQALVLTDVAKTPAADFRVVADRKSKLWVYINGDPAGVFKVDPFANAYEHFHTGSKIFTLNDNMVKSLVQDDLGAIWIGTDRGGINLVNGANNTNISYLTNKENDKGSLSYNSIENLYCDNMGIVWVGTGKKGISYINQHIVQFKLYRHEPGNPASLPYSDVNYFVEDKKGNIWIATNGGGLIYFNRQTNSFAQYLNNPNDANSLSNNVIVSLCIDFEDKLWIGTYLGGLDVFDGKTFKHYKHNPADPTSLADNRVWHILEDDDHSLWVGTLQGGLDHFNRQTQTFTHHTVKNNIPQPIHSSYIPTICKNKLGELWVGTLEGVEILNKERTSFTNLTHTNDLGSLSHQNVTEIVEDKLGMMWVGTRMGLNVYNHATKKFKRFTIDDGLPSNSIVTMVVDKQGNLWLTTPKGLCQLILQYTGDKIAFEVRNYTGINNVQGKFFNESSSGITSDGLVIAGGSTGFNLIDPQKIITSKSPSLLAFTSIDIFNNEINVGQEINKKVVLRNALPYASNISLNHNENIFSIEFAALDFSNNNQYAYKLEGFNKNWMYTSGDNRKVTYTNLDPGTYVFKLKATNSDGIWSAGEKKLVIVINPPFWSTPLAFFIYVVSFGVIVYLARRYTLERARMRFEVGQQRKESERIQALDAVKTKFFTNVSHEFRTPLSLILTPLDKIIGNTADPDQKKQIQLVQRNAKRLLNLVNQLLDFRKMEVQEFKLQPTSGDIVAFTREICCSFSDISEMKNISLSFSANVDSFVTYFDKDKLEKILFNLLSNAFKYTPIKGAVDMQLAYEEKNDSHGGQVKIVVTDTGIGIPANKQGRIFERFFQNDVPANITNPGTGIGLAITKEFIRLHNGAISVKSVADEGSSFTVLLPVQKPVRQSLGVLPINEVISPLKEPMSETKLPDAAVRKLRPTILLVEDNDDFRFYLKDNLNQAYDVVETVDGQDAWEKLAQLKPDLIVSDVMMPHMDGIELARRIKKSPQLAHTPLILLTSVGDEEMQLESYRLGVNDYMTKPFTYEILASRIKNLLAAAKQAEKKPQRLIEVNPSEIVVPQADEQFLKQVMQVIEKNMSNPEFTVEELSRDLFMHRAGMYRKLLALTGISPLEFIRDIRLKRGRQLLEKSQMTIAEIAYEVGFYNPKKFSQHFKEKFGVTPSQFQKEHVKTA